jgi:hypothetical protein
MLDKNRSDVNAISPSLLRGALKRRLVSIAKEKQLE